MVADFKWLKENAQDPQPLKKNGQAFKIAGKRR
jgi:hypothetical protein